MVTFSTKTSRGGVLRLIAINGEAQQLRKLGNNEAKVAEALESGYFGIASSNPDFIRAEIDRLVIDEKNVPDSHFQLQQRIARERGHGDIALTKDAKDEAIVRLRNDQAESLNEWADYLRSEENGHVYPDWFKVYVWESLRKMGDFDKEKGEFKKRTKSTTAPWPELNAEALAYVYDAIDTGVIRGEPSEGRLQQLLKAGNFAKLYAHAITEVGVGGSLELREITKGSWVKYDQIEGRYAPNYQRANGEFTDDAFVDNSTVIALTDSLRSMGTGWCTAGTRTAAHQLSKGDFYVYYTQDEKGDNTIPRIAIRMEDGAVTEVRGIEPGQEVEPAMLDIVAEKLKTLPGGAEYYKKVADMKWLTALYDRHLALGDEENMELSMDDLARLYEVESRVQGFGGRRDLRLLKIRCRRNLPEDLKRLFGDGGYEHCEGSLDLCRIKSTKDLVLPKSIAGDLDLSGLGFVDGLKLPERIGGDLNLYYLQSAKDLVLPREVGGNLDLVYLWRVRGRLVFPERIGGEVFLISLDSPPKNVVWPREIGAVLDVSEKFYERYASPENFGRITLLGDARHYARVMIGGIHGMDSRLLGKLKRRVYRHEILSTLNSRLFPRKGS